MKDPYFLIYISFFCLISLATAQDSEPQSEETRQYNKLINKVTGLEKQIQKLSLTIEQLSEKVRNIEQKEKKRSRSREYTCTIQPFKTPYHAKAKTKKKALKMAIQKCSSDHGELYCSSKNAFCQRSD